MKWLNFIYQTSTVFSKEKQADTLKKIVGSTAREKFKDVNVNGRNSFFLITLTHKKKPNITEKI